jgi:uncharacterized membrane protein
LTKPAGSNSIKEPVRRLVSSKTPLPIEYKSVILVPRPKLGRPSQWLWVRLLICVGIPTQRLGRTAYAILPKNMATAMNNECKEGFNTTRSNIFCTCKNK